MPSIALPASVPPRTADPPDPAADGHRCQWEGCARVAPDAELLYAHLCNDHIGRKSTNNLCLSCKWKDCGTSCAKRDHITSHLRVHTPLKPHVCDVCAKSFKRPQDLKKHEKIHTEEHHAQHKHSKAITVAPRHPAPQRPHDAPALRPPPHTNRQFGIPTPSPEIPHPDIRLQRPDYFLPPDPVPAAYAQPAYQPTGPASPAGWPHGVKRDREYDQQAPGPSVVDFLADMKRRKLDPRYDAEMASRLSTIAFPNQLSQASPPPQPQQHAFAPTPLMHTSTHAHSLSQSQGPHSHSPTAQAPQPHHHAQFNPQQISVDIRTPEELAVVNSFLVALGRDVAAGRDTREASVPDVARDGSGGGGGYFDPASLAQLGLTDMPGIAWNGGGGGSAAAYVQHPGAAGGGMFDHQHHWSMGAGAHKFEPQLEPDGVYAPFPPHAQSAGPDPRGYGGGGAYPGLSPPHHSFAGPPSTPSSSSAGGFGDRDSPLGDGGSGGAGSVGGYSPNMDAHAHAHVRQQVPPLHGYPAHAAGGPPEYDVGQFGVRAQRGQPLQPPRIAPLDYMATRYQHVPALKSVPGAREERAQGAGGEGGDAGRRYPTLPSFNSVVAATALDKSPVSPPPDADMDAEDKDTLSTLRTSGDPELKLPEIWAPPSGAAAGGMRVNPLLRPHHRAPSPQTPPPRHAQPRAQSPHAQPQSFLPSPPASYRAYTRGAPSLLRTPSPPPLPRYPALPPLLPSLNAAVSRSRAGSASAMAVDSMVERTGSAVAVERDGGAARRRDVAGADAMDVDGGSDEDEDGSWRRGRGRGTARRCSRSRSTSRSRSSSTSMSRSRSHTPVPARAAADAAADERRKHALLVRDLLVYVNEQYRARFGPPPAPPHVPAPLYAHTHTHTHAHAHGRAPGPGLVAEGMAMRGRDIEMVGA